VIFVRTPQFLTPFEITGGSGADGAGVISVVAVVGVGKLFIDRLFVSILTGFDDDDGGGGKPSFVVIDDFEFVVAVVVDSIGNDNLPDKFFGGVDGRVFVINFASLGNPDRPNAKEDVFSELDI
jgi:hypothetical protein